MNAILELMDPQLQTPPQPPVQPPQSPPPVTPGNSNRSFWKTLAIGMSIVSFGIALAVGGYLLGINKNKSPQAPTSQITSIPTPTVDPTVNWKTYTNTAFGYQFKYPNDHTVATDVNWKDGHFISATPTSTLSFIYDIPDKEVFGPGKDIPGLYFSIENSSKSSKEKAQEYLNEHRRSYLDENGLEIQAEETLFANLPASEIKGGGYINQSFRLIFISKNNMLLTIEQRTDDPLFEQILSTFKFTDSSTAGAGCKIGGCSNQICQNETDEGATTTCEYKSEYACYKTARCEKQTNGKCGWTQTAQLSSCLNSS